MDAELVKAWTPIILGFFSLISAWFAFKAKQQSKANAAKLAQVETSVNVQDTKLDVHAGELKEVKTGVNGMITKLITVEKAVSLQKGIEKGLAQAEEVQAIKDDAFKAGQADEKERAT